LKIVKEFLEESFSRGNENKIESLGIGKREMIEKWLNKYDIKNYTINDDHTIYVEGDVRLSDIPFGKFPDYIQFGDVIGSFRCYRCNLTTLKGCPTYVADNFDCEENNLTTLKYAPKHVNGSFYCRYNYLFNDNNIIKRFNIKVRNAELAYPQNIKQ